MLHAAARYVIRSAVLLGLLVTVIGGAWLAVDRLIIKAEGPHEAVMLVQSRRAMAMPRSVGN